MVKVAIMKTWLHLHFVDLNRKWSNQAHYNGNVRLKERPVSSGYVAQKRNTSEVLKQPFALILIFATIRTWQSLLDILRPLALWESTPSSSPSDLMIRLSLRGRCFPRLNSSFSVTSSLSVVQVSSHVTLHRGRGEK